MKIFRTLRIDNLHSLLIRINSFTCLKFKFLAIFTQDFTEANQAVSFFIKLYNFHDNASVQSLILENGQTQEKLVIKGKSRSRDFVRILRYPIGTNEKEWVEEMSQHTNTHNRTIEFNAQTY
jgi:hypothetical protein